ncbi:MAG: DUF1592 domain-containing protein [Bryobacteraceae bacterium]
MPFRFAALAAALVLPAIADEFSTRVLPVLGEHCSACHDPANPKNKIGFLRAKTAEDLQSARGDWTKVAMHLRNRTMPPVASKITEDQRLTVSRWVEDRLRSTACAAGEQAGSVTVRRLSRREYRSTVRDLIGVDFPVEDIFPADGSGGEGFDNNGETLFVPPILMERYVEAARQILDRAIVTPSMNKTILHYEIVPERVPDKTKPIVLKPGEEISADFTVYLDGDYDVRVTIDRPRDREKDVFVKVDGMDAGRLVFLKDANGGATSRAVTKRLSRGVHHVTARMGEFPIDFFSLRLDHKQPDPSAEKKTIHYRLFGFEPGENPANPRGAAARVLERIASRAYRRPLRAGELDRLLALYDRSAQRGDPFEERVKLALQAVLLSPHFLFRIEGEPDKPGQQPLSSFELATRLSYFLWATMPDDELWTVASADRLRDPAVLAAQVDRMLADPRSRAFANSFIGQWLGTKDVGGRLAPAVAAVQHFYTPDVAADLREEPVMLFHHLLTENRSLLELLTADYTFMTERMVKFYELEGKVSGISSNGFHYVKWPDDRRAGVLGMGSVLAMTSHYQETSPVLRGVWVLETILGVQAPSPPPDVPPLETGRKSGLSARQKLEKHRQNPSCAACHNLIDPAGFALENFDWMGRWRDKEANGQPVDAAALMPTGETVTGPVELRKALLAKREVFLRTLSGKVLGYALGRSLEDSDHCTIQHLVEKLSADGYKARTLIREVALSTPFRFHAQGVAKEMQGPVKREKLRGPLRKDQ